MLVLQGVPHFALGCLMLAFNSSNSVHEFSLFPFACQNLFSSTQQLHSSFLCSLSSLPHHSSNSSLPPFLPLSLAQKYNKNTVFLMVLGHA